MYMNLKPNKHKRISFNTTTMISLGFIGPPPEIFRFPPKIRADATMLCCMINWQTSCTLPGCLSTACMNTILRITLFNHYSCRNHECCKSKNVYFTTIWKIFMLFFFNIWDKLLQFHSTLMELNVIASH